MEVLPGAFWQRCNVHFLRNALDQLPRKIADDCLVEYDGFTIDATPKKPAEIRRPGCFAGRKNTPDSAHGSKRTSRRRLPFTDCPENFAEPLGHYLKQFFVKAL